MPGADCVRAEPKAQSECHEVCLDELAHDMTAETCDNGLA
jgi:hypothetical protein